MDDLSDLFGLFDQITACRTADDLTTSLTATAGRHGFAYWMYALNLPVVGDTQEGFLLSNCPAGWVDLYFSRKYPQQDPAVEHCHRHIIPYVWPEPVDHPPASERARAIWRIQREAREFGLMSGLSIPLHGPGCDWGMLSLATSAPLSVLELRALMPVAQLLASYAHEAGRRFAPGATLSEYPSLTPRELECLHWAAGGHTSWEIAQLIGVSERTVVFHLTNASHKLGFFSRQPAIARAVALGLVTPAASVRKPSAHEKSAFPR